MDNWESQKMLDLYIHNYLLRKNMRATAKIFAREANFRPKNVDGGFLPDWWSLFWDVYNYRLSNDLDATEGSSSKVMEMMPESDLSSMLQNVGLPPQNPVSGNFPQSVMMSAPQFCLNIFGGIPTPDASVSQRTNLNNLVAGRIHMQEHLRTHSVRPIPQSNPDNSNFLWNVMMPAPQSHLNGFGGVPASNSSVIQRRELINLVAGRMHLQEHQRVPTIDLSPNSQLHGAQEFVCESDFTQPQVLPSSGTSSQPQQQKRKTKRKFSVTRDNKCSMSVDAEPMPSAPKAWQIEAKLTDAGSSESSNLSKSGNES